jgi:hypothetical protein
MRVGGPGVLRPDADTYAEQREPDALTDQRFLKASEEIVFSGANQAEMYAWAGSDE